MSKENKMKALDRNVVSKKGIMPAKKKQQIQPVSENVETEEDFSLGHLYTDFNTNFNDYLFQTTEENSSQDSRREKEE